MTLHLRAYDHGRQESFRAICDRFSKLLAALSRALPEIEGWSGLVGGAPSTIAGDGIAEAVVASSVRMWRSGKEELVAYGPCATGLQRGLEVVKVSLIAGMGASALPVWTPNQTNVELRPPVSTEVMKNRERLEAAFLAVVRIADPAWAVVEVEGSPSPPVPPFANGAPSVGWMTFLHSTYPPLPRFLPEPSVAVDIGVGTLIVAHTSRPDHDAIARLEIALGDKVLVPARALAGTSLSATHAR